jgi:VanZ family protein
MNSKIKSWLLAVGYVLFIYATLSTVVVPMRYLRSLGLLRLTLAVVYGTAFLLLLRHLLQSQTHRMTRVGTLIFIFGLYGLITRTVKTPEEQFHFLEYGLVGVFFARALSQHWANRIGVFAGAVLLASLAGGIDEIIQGFLPNRHFDVHDIVLNATSAFLGLAIYRLLPKKNVLTTSS